MTAFSHTSPLSTHSLTPVHFTFTLTVIRWMQAHTRMQASHLPTHAGRQAPTYPPMQAGRHPPTHPCRQTGTHLPTHACRHATSQQPTHPSM